MSLKLLDLTVLIKDLPSHRLRKGDVGTVVHRYPDGALEVEFVSPSGETRALVTVTARDVRALRSTDMFSVRPTRAGAVPAARASAPKGAGRRGRSGPR
jgi:hypothetical protein